MDKKEAKLALIEIGLSGFCDEYLTMEAEEPLASLFDACVAHEGLNLTRGDPDGWAAAIAYAFCRMNFLLDGGSPAGLRLERDEFFAFFEGCNRSTVGQKATKIEKALDFHHGHPRFSMPDVVNALPRLIELPTGLIGLAHSNALPAEIRLMNAEKSRLAEEEQLERERLAEEERRSKRLAELEKKREEERKIQPELFDL
jgi:hypothetical protein